MELMLEHAQVVSAAASSEDRKKHAEVIDILLDPPQNPVRIETHCAVRDPTFAGRSGTPADLRDGLR
jgi:hypothetical protein